MGKIRVISQLFRFLHQEKKYWLTPIVIAFLLLSLLIVFSQSTPLAPFVYSLF